MSELLIPGCYYHIYNRGNNGENIFHEERNYRYFLQLYLKYIQPIAETYAYSLLFNHFHTLARMRDEAELKELSSSEELSSFLSQQYANLFGTYTKAMNKAYKRTGSLFENPFERKRVGSDSYFITLVTYIHRNPQTHGLVDDFRDWPWSSYSAMLSEKPTKVMRTGVLEWFGGQAAFVEAHLMEVNEQLIAPLIVDDFV